MAFDYPGYYDQRDWFRATLTTAITAYPFTVSYWAKGDNTPYGEDCHVYLDHTTETNMVRMCVHSGTLGGFPAGENSKSAVYIQRQSSSGADVYLPWSRQRFDYTGWNHICHVIEGSTQALMTSYVNGIACTWDSSEYSCNVISGSGLNRFAVGAAAGTASHRSSDTLSEISIYSSALTAAQVKLLAMGVRADAIGVTPKHYWPLYDSLVDLGSDGDDLVYNPTNPPPAYVDFGSHFDGSQYVCQCEWDVDEHPDIVGSATISSLTESPVVVEGESYTSGGTPYNNVPETHLAFIEKMKWGSGTYNDDKGGCVVKAKATVKDGGVSLVSGDIKFVSKQTAASLKFAEKADIVACHPFSDRQYAQFSGAQGKCIENTADLAITGYPLAVGGWIKLPAESSFMYNREHFQFYDVANGFQCAGKVGWGTYPGDNSAANDGRRTFLVGIERPGGSNFDARSDDVHGGWERWVHIHQVFAGNEDVQTWVNGVQDSEGSFTGANIFDGGNLDEFFLGGKNSDDTTEYSSQHGFAHWYMYYGTVPSSAVIAELSKFLPDTVADLPDHYWPLDGDLNDAIGSANLADVATSSFTWQTGNPRIGRKIT